MPPFRPARWLAAIMVVARTFLPAPAAAAEEANLIELSYGCFAEGSSISSVFPPRIKIYESGRAVFWKDGWFREGRLGKKRLERLRRDLARNELLRPGLQEAGEGGLCIHGGISYVRYLSGEKEVLVAFPGALPARGPWRRFQRRLEWYLPSSYRSFLPESIDVRVRRTFFPGSEEPPWPFADALSLRKAIDSTQTLSDPRMVSLVFHELEPWTLGCWARFTEQGESITLALEYVPAWFDPEPIELQLQSLELESKQR